MTEQDKNLALEIDYERNRASGSGTEIAYTVEAICTGKTPIQIGSQIFDNRWREVKFEESQIGVPRCASFNLKTLEHGMLGYAAAQALRWWLHAAAAGIISSLLLETRIVSHRISYTHKIETIAAHAHVGSHDRRNYAPDNEHGISFNRI